MPTRRQVLARAGGLGATAALGGCLWNIGGSSSFLAVHFESVPHADLGQNDVVADDELEPRARLVVDEGLGNGTTVYGRRPFRHEFLRRNETYYAIRATENGTRTVERPVLTAERVSSVDGEPGNRSALLPSDERAMRCAVATRDDHDGPPCVLYAGDVSAFWPEPELRYVERGEATYDRFSVAERNVTLDRYEYVFEPVAENRSGFADYAARERVAIDFDGANLSAKQRDILETAASRGVYRESPPPYSDALRDLAERIRNAGDGFEAYVRFDGSYYLASVKQLFN